MTYKKLIGITVISLLASACATQKTATTDPSIPRPPTVDERIAAAAETSSAALKELMMIELAKSPARKSVTSKAPEGLGTVVNVRWSGPVHQFLNTVADLSVGYTLVIRGKAPAIPVIITVDEKGTTLYELIRNAGIQAGVRANVVVDASNPAERKIILEYPA